MFFALLSEKPIFLLPWILTALLSIGWHEFFHAVAGYWQGDDTAQRAGRLTPNPLAHIDWLGFGLMVFLGFGWGKPTPFNPYNLKFKKWGSALVALAGPLSNIILVVIVLTLYRLLGYQGIDWADATNVLQAFLLFMAQLNIMLFAFNLIPIPPLDGSKVLYAMLGPRRQQLVLHLETMGPWLL
jgi:Zn-dependent protease